MKQKTSVSGSLSNKRQLTDSEINNGFSFNSVLESPSLNGQLYQMDEQLDSISKELCNFLIDKGVTPVSSNSNQLKTLLNTLFDAKQNSLVAGSNITIDENGVISATSAEAANIPLFTSIQLYCKAFNTSWVNASNYSWLYGSMYKSAYNFLKNQAYPSAVAVKGTNYYILNWSDKSTESTTVLANSGTVQDLINYANSKGYDIIDSETIASFKCEKTVSDSSETINEIDVSFKRTFSDMKIIVDDENVSKAEQIYSAIGIQNYFILDVENQRFKLPRTTRGFEGIRTKVGDYIRETIPNIEGKVGSWYGQNTRVPNVSSGPFYDMVVEQQNGSGSGTGSMLAYSQKFDASRVSDAYVNGAKVQPNATQMYLYFYLGETGSVVDHEIASQALETINNKADRDLNNIPTNIDYVIDFQAPTAENNYTWYRIYKSGWVEQGGIITSGTYSATPTNFQTTITFKKQFKDNNYIKIITPLTDFTWNVLLQQQNSIFTDTGATLYFNRVSNTTAGVDRYLQYSYEFKGISKQGV